MANFIMTITCAECNSQFAHNNPNNQENEGLCFSLDLNFKEGKINFICPECNKLNTLEVLSHENAMKNVKLPKGKAWRG